MQQIMLWRPGLTRPGCHALAALFFLLVLCPAGVHGQRMPVEFMAGHKNYYYQHSVGMKLSGTSSFGFFHTSSILIPFDEERGNEIMSQSYITISINRALSAGFGTLFSPKNRIRPSVSLQFLVQRPNTTVLIFPRADVWKQPSFELMGFWEQRSSGSKHLQFYGRLQVMTTWTFPEHNRSYQYLRVGAEHKGFGFGVAVNLDEYGKEARLYPNYGLFLRRVL
ncbi:hypothetical protein [Longitalea luteola]|uniref:hypothetical protein n=1 Tax=Longitalea luteola TaxID=2812563 RepID=UPI001F62398C|nr:hypothetical protein [Longitalea luteola]